MPPFDRFFITTIASHRNQEEDIVKKLSSKEKYINSTLVLTSDNKKTQQQLPKIQIFADNLWMGNPSLVLDDKVQFSRFFPQDIGSDKFEWQAQKDEQETDKLEDHAFSIINLTSTVPLPKAPKTTIEEAVEKLQELEGRKESDQDSTLKSDYLYENGQKVTIPKRVFLDRNKDKQHTLKHNENHIHARFHNVRSIAITKEDFNPENFTKKSSDRDKLSQIKKNSAAINLLKAIILIELINKNKAEILQDDAKIQEIVEFEKEKVTLLNAKIEYLKKTIKEFRENSFKIEQNEIEDASQYHPLLIKAFERKKVKHTHFTTDDKNQIITSPFDTSISKNGKENALLWLKNNIDKAQKTLALVTQERNLLAKRSEAEITEQVIAGLKPANLVIYDHLNAELKPIKLEKYKELLMDFIKKSDPSFLSDCIYQGISLKYIQELIFDNPELSDKYKKESADKGCLDAIIKCDIEYLKFFIEKGGAITEDYANRELRNQSTGLDLLDKIIEEKNLENLKLFADKIDTEQFESLFLKKAATSKLSNQEIVAFYKESGNENLIKAAEKLEIMQKLATYLEHLKDKKILIEITPSEDFFKQTDAKAFLNILRKEGFSLAVKEGNLCHNFSKNHEEDSKKVNLKMTLPDNLEQIEEYIIGAKPSPSPSLSKSQQKQSVQLAANQVESNSHC